MPRKTIDMTGWIMKDHGVPKSLITVLEMDDEYKKVKNIKKAEHYWKCKCDCGKIFTTGGYGLRKGLTLSCGCYKGKQIAEYSKTHQDIVCPHKTNLVGNKYGKLTVIKDTGERAKNKGEIIWLCRCDCGNFKKVKTSHLTCGHTISCGCISSKGEVKIQQILLKNHIPFIKEMTYDDLRSPKVHGLLRYDFYINNEFLLEYDGEQHFKESSMCDDTLAERQAIDKLKNDYAKKHNIPIKRIPYWDFKKITLKTIMDDTWKLNN